MSAEREYDIDHEIHGENSGEDFGMRVYPYFETNSDPNELMDNPAHPQFRKIIDVIHDAGQEAFAHVDAHRGLVITILGGAAVAAGAVGIGILIKRRNEKKQEDSS